MATGLIVIDMQVGSFGPGSPRHDADGLVARLNALGERVRTGGGTVIFVQHDGPRGDAHHPGEPGWHLLPGLNCRPGDLLVRKTACDAFLDTTLATDLARHGIRDLVITGCATDYCVDTTVRTALGRGYRTVVPADGHTTSDRTHLSALQIIAHHNAIWSDFIAPGGPASIRPCAEVCR